MPRSAAQLSIAERAARLRYTPLFRDLPARDVRRLARACQTVEAAPGDVVIAQGDPGDTFFLVVRGLLRAERVDGGGGVAALQEIHKGEFFGEFALLEDVRRSASVVVRSDATLMTLNRKDFEAVGARHPAVVARVRAQLEHRRAQHVDRSAPETAEILQRLSAMLEGVSAEALAAIEVELEWVQVPRGTELLTEGTPGDCLYFLAGGMLQAWARGPDGRPVRIGEIRIGEPVGEAALLTDEPRDATVRALTDCELVRLSRAGFARLVEGHPEVERTFRRMIERRRHLRIERSRAAALERFPHPTLEEIEAVILDPDPVSRNYGITRLYHRLGTGLARLLGEDDVNWPLFGARASYTAGYTIRKEDFRLHQVAGGTVWRRSRAWVLEKLIRHSVIERRVNATLDTVSSALAAGNLRIFAEIGPAVGRFLTTFHDDEAFDAEKLAAFLETLVDGPVETGGQDLLQQALTRWYEAAFEEDRDAKAEKIFLGNCLLALHEQTRVQPDIDEALEAPLRLVVGDEWSRWIFSRPMLRHMPLRARLGRVIDGLERAFLRTIAHALRQGTTRLMMRLRLPSGDLWLGKPIGREIAVALAPELVTLELPEVRSFVEPHGRGRPRGATDWASLPERMRYIVGLFRAVQRDRSLYLPPFENAV